MASQMSSIPSPPNDVETKTIIDKLANFVARNGPEFERMTMEKKRGDPKFAFLFGGENNPYYRWKVEMERSERIPSDRGSGGNHPPSSIGTSPVVVDSNAQLIEALNAVKCKEQNDVLKFGTSSDPFEMEFNRVVQPVMNTCSKEAIASGKSWMLSRSHSPEDCGKMAHYMMRRSLECLGVEFSHKLHLVYLINDILYHGHSAPLLEGHDLKQAIQTVIVQIIFNVFTSAPLKGNELVKMVNIWESQNCLNTEKLHQIRTILNYPIDKLPVSDPSWVDSKHESQQPLPPPAPSQSVGGTDPSPSQPPPWLQYSNQFQQSSWQPQQCPPWEQAPPSSIVPPPTGPPPGPPPAPPAASHTQPPPWATQGHQNPPWTHPPPPPPPQQQPTEPTPLFAPSDNLGAPPTNDPPTGIPSSSGDEHHDPIPDEGVGGGGIGGGMTIDYNHKPGGPLLPPPTNTDDFPQPPGIQVFDYQHRPANWRDIPPPPVGPPSFPFSSRGPPPFFPHPPPFHPHDVPPHVAPPPPPPPPLPYYDLPAGLMIPLVPLHEHNYASLKPHQVCLPAPQPPSERLLEAVEEFYYPPSQEKPRNEEGWEAKALLDFYNAKEKAKESARERSRDSRRSSRRRRSRSNSPKRRKRRSSSKSPSPARRRRRRSSRSPSSSSSDSRSPSPYKKRRRRHSSSDSSSGDSPLTPTVEELAARNKYRTNTQQSKEDSLKSDNVGHQLLKRMGWEGAGLGARSQGIQEPIKGGEARDKSNQYSGVGINMNDPFEQFRKNKSYTFNRRPPGGAPGGVPQE